MSHRCKPVYVFMSSEGLVDYEHPSEAEYGAIWKSFKEHTTAHGIPHVYHARGPLKVTIWVLLSLISLGLLGYTLYGLVVRLITWPVTVVVSVEHVKEITFPAVTLCNMNPVRNSALANDTDLRDIFTGPPSNHSMSKREVPAFSDETLFAIILKKYLAEQDLAVKLRYGHQRENLLLEAKYEGVPVSTDSFYNWFDPSLGNCFTFNSGWEDDSTSILKSHLSGPLYGLDVIFNIEQDEYIGELSHSAGLKVVIHEQNAMPFPAEQGFIVSPGAVTFIGLKKLEVKRLGGRYGNCTEITSEQNFTQNVYEQYYPVLYSSEGCLHTCYQRNVIEQCGCASADIPTKGQAFGDVTVPVCDFTEATSYECLDDVKNEYIHSELDCDCGTECEEEEFEVTTSSGLWPSDDYQESLLQTLVRDNPSLQDLLYHTNDSTKYLRSLGKLSLYFSEFNKEQITEIAAYSPTQFVSDVGGVLGLFIGFSVLTIAEFLELGMDFLVLASCKCCCRKKSRENSFVQVKPMPPSNINSTSNTVIVVGEHKNNQY